MKYADIKENDIVNGEGVSVSFWASGCPHHCKGCHNQQAWDYDYGYEDSEENVINRILKALTANNINRNLSLLGGEPLCEENIDFINKLISIVKQNHPNIKIFLWSGYTIDEINKNSKMKNALNNIDVLIEGRFILEQRDITLRWRGSRNQRILFRGKDF